MTELFDREHARKLKAQASYIGVLYNISQTVLKISFGILGNSVALIADGIHSDSQHRRFQNSLSGWSY